MKIPLFVCAAGLWTASLGAAAGSDFTPLFNGRDLAGWTNVNGAPETWTFRDGVVHCTGFPTGALRTTRQYENFILELEWRHLTSGGNSGVFIWGGPLPAPGAPFLRGIETQILDNGFNIPGKNQWYTTHGDVFPIHGATMKPFGRHNGMRGFPSEERSKSSPEWNHYRITCTNGVIRLAVNGKEVSGGSDCQYRKGYLALESEGAPVEFRNVRILELPGGQATPEQTAPLDQGWQCLFNHLDFRGWRTNDILISRWSIAGERLAVRAGVADAACVLWAAPQFPAAEILFDFRPAKGTAPTPPGSPTLWLRNAREQDAIGLRVPELKPETYHRVSLTVSGLTAVVRAGDSEIKTSLPFSVGENDRFFLGVGHAGGPAQYMNFFWRSMRQPLPFNP